jgi:hypothetical protein
MCYEKENRRKIEQMTDLMFYEKENRRKIEQTTSCATKKKTAIAPPVTLVLLLILKM